MPTPTLPGWLLGKHLTSLVITPQTVTGLELSDSLDVKSIRGTTSSIELSLDTSHDDVRPVSSEFVNNEIIGRDSSIDITTLLVRTGLNALSEIFMEYDYFKIVFQQGEEIWTGYFVCGSHRTGVSSHGGNAASMNFRQIEVNLAGGNVTLVEA